MTIVYNLTPELRLKLKEPLGTLIRGSFVETMAEFKKMVEEEKPSCIVSVGDTVSKNLEASRVFPQLSIVDNYAMRKSIPPVSLTADRTVKVKNPQATITQEAITAIQNALESNSRVKIVVDGEEDLLTLIAIQCAPAKSFVVYGQPYEGMVVVGVNQTKKAEVARILKSMESVRKAK